MNKPPRLNMEEARTRLRAVFGHYKTETDEPRDNVKGATIDMILQHYFYMQDETGNLDNDEAVEA